MKPARTASQLLQQLDEEFAWRLQEIASLRKAIQNASGIAKVALLRASLAHLYAHWEGFIKASAVGYADFICTLGVKFGDLQSSFSGVSALVQVKQIHSITKKIFVASELLSILHDLPNLKAQFSLSDHISNIGNLDYDTFCQIVQFLHIDIASYAAKKQQIDESLVGQRNNIAHGEYLLVDDQSFHSLSDDILALMRQFKTDIQNAIVLKSYFRKAANAA